MLFYQPRAMRCWHPVCVPVMITNKEIFKELHPLEKEVMEYCFLKETMDKLWVLWIIYYFCAFYFLLFYFYFFCFFFFCFSVKIYLHLVIFMFYHAMKHSLWKIMRRFRRKFLIVGQFIWTWLKDIRSCLCLIKN